MDLIGKIDSREGRIGIIGLGYTGLPLAVEFCRAGFPVTGFDTDRTKIDLLRQGKKYISSIDVSPLFTIPPVEDSKDNSFSRPAPSFSATSDFAELERMDFIIMCVPTPLTRNREPDLTWVLSTARTVSEYLRQGQAVILESTTYPGTTGGEVKSILESTGLKAGVDFCLAFSPEREDEGREETLRDTVPKVVGGWTENCLNTAKALYSTIAVRTVSMSSLKAAEAAKLFESLYRSVNTALVNELKMVFDRMGIDIWEVIEAARAASPGFEGFYPGPGFGGRSVPVDPFYLTWKAKEYGFHTRLVELAGEINTTMPDYVAAKAMKALNDVGKPLKGSAILLLGLAHKADTDDDRGSASFRLMEKLEAMGAIVAYNDPYIPEIRSTREFGRFAGRKSVELSRGYDLIIIVTAHEQYKGIDFDSLGIPVVDTRNILGRKGRLFHTA